MFNYRGDRNGRHNLPGEPMLDPISGTLLLLGLGLSVSRMRRPASFLLVIWLLLMLIPGIFSLDFESPQSYRAIGSLPAAYLIALVPIYDLWLAWDQFSLKSLSRVTRSRQIFLLPMTLVLVVVGYLNYHVYFDIQSQSFDSWSAFSTPETIAGKFMAQLGDQVDYYVSVFYFNPPTIRFIAPQITQAKKLQASESLPLNLDGNKTTAFILDADRKPAYLQLKRTYPQRSL